MTSGDYVLWISALVFIMMMGGMFVSFMKFVVEQVEEVGASLFIGSCVYFAIVLAVISPTYYLVVRN